jgi:hypothetical protein
LIEHLASVTDELRLRRSLTTRSCLKRAGEVGFEQRMTGSTTRRGLRPSEPRGRTGEQETGRDNMRLDPVSSDAESKARSLPGELYCADCFAVRTAVAMHTTLPHHDPTTTRNRGAHREVGAQGTTGPTSPWRGSGRIPEHAANRERAAPGKIATHRGGAWGRRSWKQGQGELHGRWPSRKCQLREMKTWLGATT